MDDSTRILNALVGGLTNSIAKHTERDQDELRKLRKELRHWKLRAEVAEERLFLMRSALQCGGSV